MKRITMLVVGMLAFAVAAAGIASAHRDAARAFCKRTASAKKPYVLARGSTSKLKPADIFPAPRGGCPRTILRVTSGGTALNVAMTGEAETPAGDPVGTGEATVRLRAGQGQLCFRIDTHNLSGIVAAHIHAGAAGVAGNVVVPLTTPTSGSSSGCAAAARKVVASILKAPASFYVNVHTQEFQNGAIRGQLAGTSTSSYGWIAALNLVGTTEPNAKGTAVVRLRKDAGQVCYRLHVENVSLPTTAAHIHRGGATVSGPVVVGFNAPGADGNSSGCTPAAPTLIDEIMANPAGFYVNVHTKEHPAGAIRAQLG